MADADSPPMGGTRTDATGSYEMTGVPPLAGTGQLWMWPGGDHDPLYFWRGLTFLDPGPTTFDFWPGRLPLSIQRGGPWAGGSSVSVALFGSNETSPDLETHQPLTMGVADLYSGYAYALPGDYTSAVVTFHGGGWPSRRTEALEIQMPQGAPAVVQSGQTGGVSLVADERDAARAEVTRWASGARGSMVTMRLSNLRSGDVYKITGQSMNGGEPVKTFAMVTVPSPAPSAISLRVRVPAGVPIADKYNFYATRIGGHLDLVASYQVCAFSASRHSIARGESVKLRGRVPIIPSDSGPDNTMTLTLFKHAGVSVNRGRGRQRDGRRSRRSAPISCISTGPFLDAQSASSPDDVVCDPLPALVRPELARIHVSGDCPRPLRMVESRPTMANAPQTNATLRRSSHHHLPTLRPRGPRSGRRCTGLTLRGPLAQLGERRRNMAAPVPTSALGPSRAPSSPS